MKVAWEVGVHRRTALQEWFQHPAKSSTQEHSDGAEPVVSKVLVGGEEKGTGNLPMRHSFGFGVVEHDDQTSSDGEPGKLDA